MKHSDKLTNDYYNPFHAYTLRVKNIGASFKACFYYLSQPAIITSLYQFIVKESYWEHH